MLEIDSVVTLINISDNEVILFGGKIIDIPQDAVMISWGLLWLPCQPLPISDILEW